ncbi:MAG: A/G-specific adenine glycosylase [Desulfobulbaceae bacterium]|nr:A/G-specific adenine glycosylase [Desulfobulbaceae bacterium]
MKIATPSKAVTARLHQDLLGWFAAAARPLPWREGYLPYHVWVSEIMLQQTQMERGVTYFRRWIKRFPNIATLAAASEEEVLKEWEGLGYYSRARNLHAAAQCMVRDFAGQLPDSLPELLKLPGVGKYTARAIASIAFQQDYPVVDGNVERLFARLFAIDEPVKSPAAQSTIWALAEALLPSGQARQWNQALMEFGALLCGRAAPCCNLCPVTDLCESFQTGTAAMRPVTGEAQKGIVVNFVVAVIVAEQRIYVQQRPAGVRWASLWEFPGGHLEDGAPPAEAVIRAVQEETQFVIETQIPLPVVRHAYTKYRATLYPFLCHLPSPILPTLHTAQNYRWLPLPDLERLAFSAGHRQIISRLSKVSDLNRIAGLPE